MAFVSNTQNARSLSNKALKTKVPEGGRGSSILIPGPEESGPGGTKLGPTGRRLETATHPSPTLLTNTVTYCTVHTRRHSPGIGGAPSGINQQSTPPTRVVGYKFKNLYPPTPNI